MKINDHQKLDARLARIHELERVRDGAIAELAKLTGIEIQGKNLPATLPTGLNLTEEIRKVFETKGTKLSPKDVKKELDQLYGIDLDRPNVQSTMTYMHKKGILAKEIEHGKFSLKKSESS